MGVDDDPFELLLNLETTYETNGYDDGFRDGKMQAYNSAMFFGIEKGFEKFAPMTHLRAKAETWARQNNVMTTDDMRTKDPVSSTNPRIEKHIKTLLALTDLLSLSTANTDEAVGDFDERLKRAQAKVKVLERVLGEESAVTNSSVFPRSTVLKSSMDGHVEIEDPRLNAIALQDSPR